MNTNPTKWHLPTLQIALLKQKNYPKSPTQKSIFEASSVPSSIDMLPMIISLPLIPEKQMKLGSYLFCQSLDQQFRDFPIAKQMRWTNQTCKNSSSTDLQGENILIYNMSVQGYIPLKELCNIHKTSRIKFENKSLQKSPATTSKKMKTNPTKRHLHTSRNSSAQVKNDPKSPTQKGIFEDSTPKKMSHTSSVKIASTDSQTAPN